MAARQTWFVAKAEGLITSMASYAAVMTEIYGLARVLDVERRTWDLCLLLIAFAISVMLEISHFRAMLTDPGCTYR